MNETQPDRASVAARPSPPRWQILWATLVALGVAAGLLRGAARPEAGAPVDFNRDVRPILSDHCFSCHGPDKQKRKGGFRLDVREEALRKLDSGHIPILPGKPAGSRLLEVVRLPESHDDHMPPTKGGRSLSPSQIDTLSRWIAQGAAWAEHWAYVPPERPAPPSVRDVKWPRNGIDHFILASLEKQGFKPNPEADRYALLRRVTLDLTGLPPSIEEADAFARETAPDAYERLVDRLLSSPHFGERMALAWLDEARYADTSGYHFDGFRQMHLWRDWVINAFNRNQPFDQFTIEQLAGDLLPNPTLEQRIATGFHRNVMTTDEGGVDPEEYMAKYTADRVTTTAQVWLGTTMGCAECHDHKYDPVTTREFYQLKAFFNGVPERGLDGTRVRNPAPVLKVPSQEQGSRLLGFLEKIPAAERKLSEAESALPKAQASWEASLAATLPPATNQALLSGLTLRFAAEAAATAGGGITGRPVELKGDPQGVAQVPLATPPERTNAFSYGAWVFPRAKTGAVLSKMEEAPSYRGFDLLLADGRVEVHLVNRFPENALKVSTRDTLATNQWHHLLVTHDGTGKAAGVKVYIDGLVRAVDAPHDSLTAPISTPEPLRIGSRKGAFALEGSIQDLRFYSRALPAAEATALFDEGIEAVARRAPDRRTSDQQELLRSHFRDRKAVDYLSARDRLSALRREKEQLLEQIPDTMVMEEMETPRETFILLRGNYLNKGEKVLPGTPACWPPLPAGPTNRLSLARWIASTNNPLTARVTVNRWWAMLFGAGLVRTSNDFGSQGDRPSHPELLDWLACEFMRPHDPLAHDWDIRHMLRLMVTSATYRQSATLPREKLERDPYNRLLTRGPRFRLEAELLRDNALAVSGLLDQRIGGPSVKPYQPPGIWEGTDHKYEQSHGADLYRRGMYVFWKRAAHYPSFQTFDAPSRETCTLLRPRTSTPLQSLVMMNDPVYVEAARALAAQALAHGGTDLRSRLTHAFRRTLGRPPAKGELAVLEQTYRRELDRFARDPKAAEELLAVGESPRPREANPVELAAMTGVANILLNLNETLTK